MYQFRSTVDSDGTFSPWAKVSDDNVLPQIQAVFDAYPHTHKVALTDDDGLRCQWRRLPPEHPAVAAAQQPTEQARGLTLAREEIERSN